MIGGSIAGGISGRLNKHSMMVDVNMVWSNPDYGMSQFWSFSLWAWVVLKIICLTILITLKYGYTGSDFLSII